MTTSIIPIIESLLKINEKVLKLTMKGLSPQVGSTDEKARLRTLPLTWFQKERINVSQFCDEEELASIDRIYKEILESSERRTRRKVYIDNLKQLKNDLTKLRSYALTKPTENDLEPPDFSPLISDKIMQSILERRWDEAAKCIKVNAPLAGIVMMGGLLEALLLARLLTLDNTDEAFKKKSTPKDHKTGKALSLKEWGLRDFINVAHEFGWITQTGKDVSEVVCEYRNYIHPTKELRHNISLDEGDSRLLWDVFRSIARQVILSTSK